MTLHLVRRGAQPIARPTDWVIDLEPLALRDRGNPPVPAGPLSHDQLVELLFRARRVITW